MSPLVNSRPRVISSLRGPDRSEYDCTRCRLRKQTCDRKLPHCTRCLAHDPFRKIHCQFVPLPTYPVETTQPSEPLLKLSNKQWRMTDLGRQQLGKLLLSDVDLFNGVPDGMKQFTETLISDCGHTIDELLQDNIFKWFPIVEPCYMDKYSSQIDPIWCEKDPDRFLPLLHMAILLVTSPPAESYSVLGIREGLVVHTDLYKAVKALYAVVSGNTKAHPHLVQTLGLIALYEFGIGLFEQTHITLNSALAMATMVRDYTMDNEPLITWQLCLITLDRMIAMSTHSRICNNGSFQEPNRLPLICGSKHPLSKEVENMLYNYKHCRYPRNSEEAVQRIFIMNEGVARAGRILQRHKGRNEDPKYDYISDSDSDDGPNERPDRYRTVGLEEDKRAMMDENGNPKAPDYWSGHDPQVLCLSAMLVDEYYKERPEDRQSWFNEPRRRRENWRGKCEDIALDACTALITMSANSEVDMKQLSVVSMFCIIHNLAITVKDSTSDFAVEKVKAFEPVMEKFAERWPFAQNYVDQLQRYIMTIEERQERCPYY